MQRLAYLLVTICVWACTLPVLAQVPKPGPPPQQDKTLIYGGYIVALVMLAAVCTACFKSSKRTHLD